jgi:tRNA(fMet)-specific endonuclease VapC
MYMLDTNAIIMAIRHPDWPICDRIRQHLGKDLCISAVTYGELEYGIQKSMSPQRNRLAITQILLGIRIMDFDASAAAHFGDIFASLEKANMRIGDRDMMIAGHARSLGCTLVTDNLKEFTRVPDLEVEDWK